MANGTTWRARFVLVGFSCLAVVTTIVNKHVLSDLRFTYPTVFQRGTVRFPHGPIHAFCDSNSIRFGIGWQTGTAALVLLSMNALGYIDVNIVPVNRIVLMSWLPSSVLFSGIIYSGSVALSRLPVPVFCAIHYISILIQTLLESFYLKKDPSVSSQFSLILTAISVVMVAGTDYQFDLMGYKWMMAHCGFSALYVLYGKSRKKNSLSDLDKMFYNAVTSVFILMIVSITTGELYRLIEFPYLYSRHFHLWCMASGGFGAALGICHVFLLSTELHSSMGIVNSLNKVAVSCLSLFIFDISPSADMAASIIVALFSGVFYSYTITPHRDSEQRISIPVQNSYLATQPSHSV